MLEMQGVTKRFPGVLANDSVDFDVRAGEIHTLLGENGAGKSTLMKILYGIHQPDEGRILMAGSPVTIGEPADAIRLGIGMVHQHFMLVPTLTVAENVALGLASARRPLTDLETVSNKLIELGDRYRMRVSPDVQVWKLSVGERQRVEILKALYRNARLLVLDEPTAVLTPQEADDLFVTLRAMTGEGKGIVFISHKLREVLAISNRITVLRSGKVVGSADPVTASRDDLARLMVGRDVDLVPNKTRAEPGEVLLRVANLTARSDRDEVALDDFGFEARSSEILGIAGVSGNGQRELAEAIAGLRPLERGTVEIRGVDVTGATPRQIRSHRFAYVPEERMREGAIAEFTVSENLALIDHRAPRFSRRGFLRLGDIRRRSAELVDEFTVKTPSIDTHCGALSGGNIQKMIMARELSDDPVVILAAQPTRGVDVGAAEYIHRRLIEARDGGAAVIMISEDLDELLGVADRILVMYEGKVAGIVDAGGADRTAIGLMMAGAH
jgi:simple sugar transport system ATP-binding protein